MGVYTTTVRSICENLTGNMERVGYSGIKEVIEGAIPKIFDFEFPVHDEAYRNVLCTKILKHYYMREIGAETFAMWKFWLDTRLNEIMPYYVQLYKSATLEFNPLYDVDITRSKSGSTGGSTDVTDSVVDTESVSGEKTSQYSGTANYTNKHDTTHTEDTLNLYNDTPQGTTESLLLLDHLTDARQIKVGGGDMTESNGENESTGSSTENNNNNTERTTNKTGKTVASTTEEYLETIKGKNGGTSYAKMLQDYRKTFVNIDMMVIEDLADLFFTLW